MGGGCHVCARQLSQAGQPEPSPLRPALLRPQGPVESSSSLPTPVLPTGKPHPQRGWDLPKAAAVCAEVGSAPGAPLSSSGTDRHHDHSRAAQGPRVRPEAAGDGSRGRAGGTWTAQVWRGSFRLSEAGFDLWNLRLWTGVSSQALQAIDTRAKRLAASGLEGLPGPLPLLVLWHFRVRPLFPPPGWHPAGWPWVPPAWAV